MLQILFSFWVLNAIYHQLFYLFFTWPIIMGTLYDCLHKTPTQHFPTLRHLSLTSLRSMLSLAIFILLTSPYSVHIPKHFLSSLWKKSLLFQIKGHSLYWLPISSLPLTTSCSRHFKPFGSLTCHDISTLMLFACTTPSPLA